MWNMTCAYSWATLMRASTRPCPGSLHNRQLPMGMGGGPDQSETDPKTTEPQERQKIQNYTDDYPRQEGRWRIHTIVQEHHWRSRYPNQTGGDHSLDNTSGSVPETLVSTNCTKCRDKTSNTQKHRTTGVDCAHWITPESIRKTETPSGLVSNGGGKFHILDIREEPSLPKDMMLVAVNEGPWRQTLESHLSSRNDNQYRPRRPCMLPITDVSLYWPMYSNLPITFSLYFLPLRTYSRRVSLHGTLGPFHWFKKNRFCQTSRRNRSMRI